MSYGTIWVGGERESLHFLKKLTMVHPAFLRVDMHLSATAFSSLQFPLPLWLQILGGEGRKRKGNDRREAGKGEME